MDTLKVTYWSSIKIEDGVTFLAFNTIKLVLLKQLTENWKRLVW